MKHRPLLLTTTLLFACSPEPLRPSDVGPLLESPSGSIHSKATLIGGAADQGLALASLDATDIGAIRLALTEAGRLPGLEQRVARLQALSDAIAPAGRSTRQLRRALSESKRTACGIALDEAAQNLVQDGPNDWHYELRLSFDECSMGRVSGSLDLRGELHVDPDTNFATATTTEHFQSFCTASGQTCVSGDVVALSSSPDGIRTLVVAWSLEYSSLAALPPIGRTQLEGGLEIKQALEARPRQLVFTTDDQGKEVTLAIRIGEDHHQLEIVGRDGSARCQLDEQGGGNCANGLVWTAADVRAIRFKDQR